MKSEDITTHMKPKDKLDSLKFISKLQRDEFHNRQKHEWKILFTTLTAYALLVATLLQYPNRVNADEMKWLPYSIILFIILIAVVYIIYRIFIQRNNHKNKSYAHQAENALQERIPYDGENAIVAILNGDEPGIVIEKGDPPKIVIKKELERWNEPIHLWSTGCHIAIVILFALVACIMVLSIASQEETGLTGGSGVVETAETASLLRSSE